MAKARKLLPKIERCVREVKKQGKTKLSSIKICQKSVGHMA